jgi:hypothetical protein
MGRNEGGGSRQRVRQQRGRTRGAFTGPTATGGGAPPAVNPAAAPDQIAQVAIGPSRATGAGPVSRIAAQQRRLRPPMRGNLPRLSAQPAPVRPPLPRRRSTVPIPGLGDGTVSNTVSGPGGDFVIGRAGPKQFRAFEFGTQRILGDYTRSDNALRAARRAAAKT